MTVIWLSLIYMQLFYVWETIFFSQIKQLGIKNKMYRSLKEDKGHRDIEVNCEYITVETKAAHQQNWEILSCSRIGSENKVIH